MKHELFAGWLVFAVACSGPAADAGEDAPPPDGAVEPPSSGEPLVVVRTPNGGETYRGTPVDIAWKATDDGGDVTFEVVALRGLEELPIAQGTMRSGAGSMSWQPPAVGAPTAFRIRITVRDGHHAVSDQSDEDFMVAPLDQPVSLANDLQPILSQRCAGSQCHGGAMPADGLLLVATATHGELVGQPSTQGCPQVLVAPGAPDDSYLMYKLLGAGDCFGGERMPRGQPALSQSEIDLFAAWIADGAPNN